jgi:hypothetical protein
VPGQLLAVGVIVIVAVMGALVALIAVKDGTLFPEPLAANPMPGLLLAQVNVVPETGPVSGVAGTASPLQWIWLFIGSTEAVGCTDIIYDEGVPVHPFAVGVMVTVDNNVELVELVAVKEGILLPDPLAANPMAVLLLVQVNVVPDTGPEIGVIGTVAPAQ